MTQILDEYAIVLARLDDIDTLIELLVIEGASHEIHSETLSILALVSARYYNGKYTVTVVDAFQSSRARESARYTALFASCDRTTVFQSSRARESARYAGACDAGHRLFHVSILARS